MRRRGLTKRQRKRKKAKQIENRKLIKKYYWLRPRYAWSGKPIKDYDYTYHELSDVWGKGWNKAFGEKLIEELGEAVKEAGLNNFNIVQAKEKFGEIRIYTSYITDKIDEVIEKYTYLSRHICYFCGKKAPIVDDGWVLPRCFDCYCKQYRKQEKWAINHYSDYIVKTDEELRKMYDERIVEEIQDE